MEEEAKSNRMSIIGEGIEGLVTKSLHTALNQVCKLCVTEEEGPLSPAPNEV